MFSDTSHLTNGDGDAGTRVLVGFFSLFSSDVISLSRKVKNYEKGSKE